MIGEHTEKRILSFNVKDHNSNMILEFWERIYQDYKNSENMESKTTFYKSTLTTCVVIEYQKIQMIYDLKCEFKRTKYDKI